MLPTLIIEGDGSIGPHIRLVQIKNSSDSYESWMDVVDIKKNFALTGKKTW